MRFLIGRIGNGLLILWGVVTLLFFIFHALPSDPARMLLGQRSDLSSEEAIRKELGLDQPLMLQYVVYLNDLSPISYYSDNSNHAFRYPEGFTSAQPLFKAGNGHLFVKTPWLRRSYQTRLPVSEMLSVAFPATLLLATVSMIIAFIAGVLLGALAAHYKGKWADRMLLVASVLGMSVPSFFASVLMAWVFAWLLGDFTGLPMFGSLYEADDLGRGEYIAWSHLVLPALTLAVRPLAVFISLTRNSVLDVMQAEYIRTARSKGLSSRKIFLKHVLRNALNPVVTSASGWFASLLAGAVFVEYVFDWKGIGFLVVQSLEKYDLPVLMGCLFIVAIMFVIINILLDLTYRLLDPRVKLN